MKNYIDCDCGNEMIRIHKDKEFMSTDLSIYKVFNDYSILHRLSHIWHIIRWGHPFTDQLCLSDKSVKKLIKSLEKSLTIK